ncbi:hypothetical protein AK830_g2118 [Neonectria ditissima]|uniref:L-tyrosine decarboxylase n=1 Tax=Neonectria ditissima TaxID=78410 RepID=A0A0P7B456_9HYPO|nr:hypothetical protein AK830_g2118 [Neonectria ditissima]
MSGERTEEFNATHSYFIGPKGANLPDFRANINTILDELLEARQNYYPEDQRFISKQVRRSDKFLEVRANLSLATQKVAQLLGEHSAPFWSPRYQAHMATDLTMSSLLGYFMTMLYNPNNVALEASPMTTLVELRVGQQLCELFGYNIHEEKSPLAWGHITCDGSVANLESIWVVTDANTLDSTARNLKFYPLSLFKAVTHGKLKFIAEKFKITPCKKGSPEKLFKDLDEWELINLRPETVLDLPKKLNEQFGITGQFLEGALNEYNIQTVGREVFNIKNPMQYFVSKTRHYSWPKGAAIAGLGSGNVVGVDVDIGARMDMAVLEEKLQQCVKSKTAVYAVVAVVGSTEEGAVDRLTDILALREKFQNEHGLSFLVHADAAWGGYFATMLNRHKHCVATGPDSSIKPDPESYLDRETVEDLQALQHADSITVDPHKAGYIPYPAGSLVYRDGRMRHLVTWSGPYLSQGSADNIGVYGVEGSKPGASAMSAWFSNQTIGLNHRGYGMLLGEATFTSARLSAHYATMINDDFICVPFNMLPAEDKGNNSFFSEPVEKQRQEIRDLIIGKEDYDIFKSEDAMKIIRQLGSDLNINAFALNWKHENGDLNTDPDEASYFMKKVVDKLSITTANTDPTKIPIMLTSTQFALADYGKCAEAFMDRIGVHRSCQSLFVVRNVVMSPFPTQMNFILKLMKDLEDQIREEVEDCRKRNTPGKGKVQFLVQGSPHDSEVFLVFQTSFHSATRRQQLIVTATLDDKFKSFYESLAKDDAEIVILESNDPLDIKTIVENIGTPDSPEFSAKMYGRDSPEHSLSGAVLLKSVVKSRPLNSAHRDDEYPADFMPFYLYGTQQDTHISHMLVKAPNIALCASNLTFTPDLPEESAPLLAEGLVLGLSEVPENAMQPFLEKNDNLPAGFFFGKGKQFQVKVWKDPKSPGEEGLGLLEDLGDPLYTGEVTLGGHVLVDAEGLNRDEFLDKPPVSDSWQKELDKIGSMLDGTYDTKCQEGHF